MYKLSIFLVVVQCFALQSAAAEQFTFLTVNLLWCPWNKDQGTPTWGDVGRAAVKSLYH